MLVTLLTKIMTSYPLIQNTVILRRLGVAILADIADIIKIITRFIKQPFEDSRKLKELESMY